MPRYLITVLCPRPPSLISSEHLVLTPNSRIARELGVQPRSLQSVAVDALRREGWRIATPLAAAMALRRALSDEKLASAGVDALYREMVGAAIRSGIDLDKLAAADSPRARALARVAIRYVSI